MGKIGWLYDKQGNNTPTQGINDSGIATFKGSEVIENIARECGQNSTDAADPELNQVQLSFKMVSVNIADYPELEGMINTIDECADYWEDSSDERSKSFFKEAKETIHSQKTNLFIISDYNTTGASGAANPDREARTKWKALTSSNGVSENSYGSGGAYGIGKNAPFAASSLRTVFYNTYSKEDNVKAIQGTSKLVTHKHGGELYQGYGFCWNTETQMPIFDSEDSQLMKLLNRTTYGTDVVVVGFNKNNNWQEEIEKAVLKNFFMAIADQSLVVTIDEFEINYENIKARLEYYASKEADLPQSERLVTINYEFYNTFVDPDHKITGNIMEEDDVLLYIKLNDSYSRKIAHIRASGMLIFSRSKNQFKHYSAVLKVNKGEFNNLLKTIEPPTHDKWDVGIIEEETKFKVAKKYRDKLYKFVNDSITEYCKGESLDEVDLDGISEYLSFDDDDSALGEENSNNSDDIESNVEPEDVKKHKSSTIQQVITSKKTEGIKDDYFEPINDSSGGNIGGSGGIEDLNGGKSIKVPENGESKMLVPKVISQRIIGTLKDGLYKASFKFDKNANEIKISLNAIGDDNNKEPLIIQSYKYEKGETIDVSSNFLTIRNVLANQTIELFITLEYKERLALEMKVKQGD